MISRQSILLLCGLLLLGACTKEPPPRTADEFIDNPMLLEAAMVRCSRNRAESKYDAECINARDAVRRIEAKEEAERRASLEESSERKRRALRRTQEAAAEARRRAAEMERQRREAEYLAQFGDLPPDEESAEQNELVGNVPTADVPGAADDTEGVSGSRDITVPASDGGNAPVVEAAPEPEPGNDLESIRDELRRRNEENGS